MFRARPFVTGVLLHLCVLSAWAGVEEYAYVEPGPCIQRQPALEERWRSGMAFFNAGAYADARLTFQRCWADCTNDPAPLFMAALSAWGLGDRAQAVRWLVQVQRTSKSHAAAFALGALHMDAATVAIPIGWIQRGLAAAPEAERAYWVSRSDFDRLWTSGGAPWVELLNEYGLPRDRDVLRAIAAQPERTQPAEAVESHPRMVLRLSPLDPERSLTDRSIEMRKLAIQRMVDRIRSPAEIPALPEELEGALTEPEQP